MQEWRLSPERRRLGPGIAREDGVGLIGHGPLCQAESADPDAMARHLVFLTPLAPHPEIPFGNNHDFRRGYDHHTICCAHVISARPGLDEFRPAA